MDLNKHLKFFDPLNEVKHSVHIIGCGAIGSTVAELLVRMGVSELHIYDFDNVSPHNISNQMFYNNHIGKNKIYALSEILTAINPNVILNQHEAGYDNQKLAGYVFLCVDNIDLRRKICNENKYNQQIKAVFDFRMRLTDAQHYAANWDYPDSRDKLLKTMQFTHEEAKEGTPVNACGTSLNIISTVRSITALGVANFINFVKEQKLKELILIDSFSFILDAF